MGIHIDGHPWIYRCEDRAAGSHPHQLHLAAQANDLRWCHTEIHSMRQRRLDPGRTWLAIFLALFCASGGIGTLSAAAQEIAPAPVERTQAIPSAVAQSAAPSVL